MVSGFMALFVFWNFLVTLYQREWLASSEFYVTAEVGGAVSDIDL